MVTTVKNEWLKAFEKQLKSFEKEYQKQAKKQMIILSKKAMAYQSRLSFLYHQGD